MTLALLTNRGAPVDEGLLDERSVWWVSACVSRYVFIQGLCLFSSVQTSVEGDRQRPLMRAERELHDCVRRAKEAADRCAGAHAGDRPMIASAQDAVRAGEATVQQLRGQARDLVRQETGDNTFTNVNYIIPNFILTQLPIGLIGLLIVAILMAATDTIAGELNSLSTATVIDFYRRFWGATADDKHCECVKQ